MFYHCSRRNNHWFAIWALQETVGFLSDLSKKKSTDSSQMDEVTFWNRFRVLVQSFSLILIQKKVSGYLLLLWKKSQTYCSSCTLPEYCRCWLTMDNIDLILCDNNSKGKTILYKVEFCNHLVFWIPSFSIILKQTNQARKTSFFYSNRQE